ncbi:MAG TPA: PAS domain S-box protein [Candidatus Eisenbacteria bacterium]|nr:PAS domain S-box protein [Candidatus Eisenbacteria bacterium]
MGRQPEPAHSQVYLAAIVESSDDAIISKDLNGIIRSFNSSAERLFGYRAEEIVGRPVTILIPPDRPSEENEILARLRRGEKVDHFETVRMAKDGRLLDVSLSVSPVRDASGKIVGAAKILRDITEKKRVARTLAAQQEWFRVTLASIGDGVIASDPEGCVTFLNPVAEQLTGWDAKAALGKPLAEVFHIVNENTRRKVENPAHRVLREGVTVGLANHTVLIARDGQEAPIDDSAAPILDDQRQTIGVVLVFRDVTERRRTEVERQAAAEERELLLRRERQARTDAERADRVKDDFVAMVSHELRTPLSAILGWTHVLEKKLHDAEVLRHGLEVISRNARVQAQLVSDLLDVSRIVSDKLMLDHESVDLGSLVRESVEAVQPMADGQGLSLVCEIEGPIPPLVGDPARLKQVVWNLVSNAVKFTAQGGRIEVRARSFGSHAEIVVADTGIGIPPGDLGQLFDRFRQSGPTTTRRYGGLGLGLSIANHLVSLHGGTVRAASDGEGKGATFTVELPLTPVIDEGSREPAKADATSADSGLLEGITVLVVEDETDMRGMIQLLLEERGARVLAAPSADEALALLDRGPDILLSDIRLPDVDGYELIRRIRQREDALAAIPAVALTAFARAEDRTRALRAGFQGHLSKPFEQTELVVMLASFAEIIRAHRDEAASS